VATVEVLLGQDGPFSTPHDYLLSAGEAFEPTAVFAIYDGSAAAGAFLACLTFVSQDGRVLARVFPESAVPAGDTAQVTFSPFALAVSSTAGFIAGAPNVLLPPLAAMLADGSAGNNAPQRLRVQGTDASPRKVYPVIAFDGATLTETVFWTFRMPDDYVSGGSLMIDWYINLTAGAVKWQAAIGAVTPGDVDTPIEHALAAVSATVTNVNTVEANRLTQTVIVLANLDSVQAGDLVFIKLFRNPNDAQDTAGADAIFVVAAFTYVH
jgi:hypothetical protein